MLEIKRDIFTRDQVFGELHARIVKQHKVPDHTTKLLYDNRNTKNFCVLSRHFLILNEKIFLHYDCSTWLKLDAVTATAPVRVDSIAIYNDVQEYTKAFRTETSKPGAEAYDQN